MQPFNATDCGTEYEFSDDESYADAHQENCGRAAAIGTDGGAAIANASSGTAVASASGPATAASVTKPGQATAISVAGYGGSAKSFAGV